MVEPIIEVTSSPVPMSRIKSALLAVPWVRAVFQTLGDGPAEVPRAALPVDVIPNLRALARSKVHPVRMPSSMIARFAVGKPSASKGREAPVRGRCGSSMTDRCAGNIWVPKSSRNHDAPRPTDAPLTAAKR